MSRRILTTLASALLAAAIVVGGTAIAANKAKTKTIKLEGTVHAHATGDGTKIAGNVTDKHLGAGAIVYDTAAAGTGVKTPFTSFAKTGSFKGTATSDNTINPDTTVTIANCTIKVTGGAGAFKGAKGSATCSGHGDAQGNDTITYKGSVKVPK
jgi:hypothetical protein